eukprot:11205648-Alexandrium_andersonii.AAC.1
MSMTNEHARCGNTKRLTYELQCPRAAYLQTTAQQLLLTYQLPALSRCCYGLLLLRITPMLHCFGCAVVSAGDSAAMKC